MGNSYIATLVDYNTLYLFSGIKIKTNLKHTQSIDHIKGELNVKMGEENIINCHTR